LLFDSIQGLSFQIFSCFPLGVNFRHSSHRLILPLLLLFCVVVVVLFNLCSWCYCIIPKISKSSVLLQDFVKPLCTCSIAASLKWTHTLSLPAKGTPRNRRVFFIQCPSLRQDTFFLQPFMNDFLFLGSSISALSHPTRLNCFSSHSHRATRCRGTRRSRRRSTECSAGPQQGHHASAQDEGSFSSFSAAFSAYTRPSVAFVLLISAAGCK
jgi:hypothetical protein